MPRILILLVFLVQSVGFAATISQEARDRALKSAIVWQNPAVPVEKADMTQPEIPLHLLDEKGEITCKWHPKKSVNGMTPKFFCKTPDGETVKVKYHSKKSLDNNKEIPAELIASRLLTVLGFGADHMYLVKKVNCYGCPKNPFTVTGQLQSKIKRVREGFLKTYGTRDENGNLVYLPDYSKSRTFEQVAVEVKLEGKTIKTPNGKGWSWGELADVDPELGGASLTEIDALRLMVRFTMNSDIKAENQRLTCLSGITDDGECDQAIAYMQDNGVGFASGIKMGIKHTRVDVKKWNSSDIFADRATCLLKTSTSLTGSFPEVNISEKGRLFLSGLMERLSDDQIRDLFASARLTEVEAWLDAFKTKRAQITEHPGCPQ